MWNTFNSDRNQDIWEYTEFGSKCNNWNKFRRTIYCRLLNRDKQYYIPGMRPDTSIITNIGIGGDLMII